MSRALRLERPLRSDGMMTFVEIARELGITPQTVQRTYKRAMRKLRLRRAVIARPIGCNP